MTRFNGEKALHNSGARTQKKKQNLESRAKRALYKDPHLRSSPLQGEGKKREAVRRDSTHVAA